MGDPAGGAAASDRASRSPSVCTYTGHTALTRMPRMPSSFASAWVRPFTPNLAAQYAAFRALPRFPARLDMLMMLAPALMRRAADWHANSTPVRLVSMTLDQKR